MKLSRYNIISNSFLYNTKSKALLKINDNYKNIFNNNALHLLSKDEINLLRKSSIIVENNEIETSEIINKLNKYESEHLNITIFINMKCNFKCLYCYENHDNTELSDIHLNKLLTIIKNTNIKHLHIGWFGGEPSLSINKIINFLENINDFCHKNNIEFSSNMTTNFYTLDVQTLEKLVFLGLDTFQITLDGLPETHNKYRPLKSGEGSFVKIVENLKNVLASDLNIKIILRLNYDKYTDYNEYLKYISNLISHDKRIIFNHNSINQWSNNYMDFAFQSYNESKERDAQLYSLEKKYGLTKDAENFSFTSFSPCYACRKNSFILYVDGTIRKCTVHINDKENILGHINDFNNVDDTFWTSMSYNECENCKLFPLCLGKCCRFARFNDKATCESNKIKELLMIGDTIWK